MENQASENLIKLINHLNSDQASLVNLITNLFGNNNGYLEDFKLSFPYLLLDFKTTLVAVICDEKMQQQFGIDEKMQQQLGIKENFKDYVIDVEKLLDGDVVKSEVQNELDKLKIPDEGMKVILNNFLDNCKFEGIELTEFEELEKGEEKKIKVTLDSDNDFIKICKFMYQMLYNEGKLNSDPFDNGDDGVTSLREILEKYKGFFENIFNIKNIKGYFQNLEKIECEDQTFKKLINAFRGAKNISSEIIVFIEQVKKEEKDETKKIKVDLNKAKEEDEINNKVIEQVKKEEKGEIKKIEVDPDKKNEINNKSDDVGNQKIKMNLLKIRARIEEICEIVFSVGGLGLTALIALGILPWGALGIGICATLAFIGMTRFIATNSWTVYHNYKYNKKGLFNRDWDNDLLFLFKHIITPAVFLIAGAILTAFGAIGILSLSLGLSLGIPLLGSFAAGVISWIAPRKAIHSLEIMHKDNCWGVCMGISAVIAVATFLGLGFGGILALPTAIALAAPLCILAVGIGSLTLFAWVVNKYGPAKLKGWLKDSDGEISCLGFGYFKDKSHNPDQEPGENELLINND